MACIHTLPGEIIEKIGQSLPLVDVRALRLTCRDIQTKLTHSFERRFFTTKTVHLVASSLQQLVALSETHYGDFVEFLVVEFEENCIIDAIGPDNKLEEGMSVPAVMSAVAFQGSLRANKTDVYLGDQIVLSREAADRYNAFVAEKKTTVEEGLHLELLTEALHNLRHVRAVKLSDNGDTYFDETFYDYARERVAAGGYESTQQDERLREPCVDICGYSDWDHPFTIFRAALFKSGRQIEELDLDFNITGEDILSVDPPATMGLDFTMQKLRKLSMAVQYPDGEMMAGGLLDWAPNIEELQIKKMASLFKPPFAVYSAVAFSELPRLQVIDLYEMSFHATVLATMLEKHQFTLSAVKLRSVIVDGSWLPVFRRLSKSSTIKSAVVRDLGIHVPGVTETIRIFCSRSDRKEQETAREISSLLWGYLVSGRAREEEHLLGELLTSRGIVLSWYENSEGTFDCSDYGGEGHEVDEELLVANKGRFMVLELVLKSETKHMDDGWI